MKKSVEEFKYNTQAHNQGKINESQELSAEQLHKDIKIHRFLEIFYAVILKITRKRLLPTHTM